MSTPEELEFNEGDRVQYKIDVNGDRVSEGVVQKVLRGGESLMATVASDKPSIPRYVRIVYCICRY